MARPLKCIVGQPTEVLLSADEEALFAEYSAEYFQPYWFYSRGHLTPAWDMVLERGLLGIQREAEERAACLAPGETDAAQRREFWEAIAVCCQSAVALSARYAEVVARMAASAGDPNRRAELEKIAAACRRVPGCPRGRSTRPSSRSGSSTLFCTPFVEHGTTRWAASIRSCFHTTGRTPRAV